MTTRRVALIGLLFVLSAGCASADKPTSSTKTIPPTTTSTAPSTTTSVVEAATAATDDSAGTYATTDPEYYCSGLLWAIRELGEEIPEMVSGLSIDDADECVLEFVPTIPGFSENAAGNTPENLFVAGCGPLSVEANRAMDVEISPSGQAALDEETLTIIARQICELPFRIGVEMGDEWQILRSGGVCYEFDFTPSPEQVESGMVPCPQGGE